MADATLRDLSAVTDIAATDVLPKQGTTGALKKITGTNFGASFESGGGIELSLAAAQAAAAGADTRLQYNNGGARGGDQDLTWDNSGKALTLGAVTVATQLKLPQSYDPVSPTLAFGDGDSGLFSTGSGVIHIGIAGGLLFFNSSGKIQIDPTASRPAILDEAASGTNPTLSPVGGDPSTGIGTQAADKLSLIAGDVELARASESTQDAFMFFVDDFGIVRYAQNELKADAQDFQNGCIIWVDESANKLYFATRYSSDALKSGFINLT